jgi:hypothetical protein
MTVIPTAHEHEGPVYCGQDEREKNKFFQVRGEIGKDALRCGLYTTYFEDARTGIAIQQLPRNILEKAILIEDPRNHPDICYEDSVGWRVRS